MKKYSLLSPLPIGLAAIIGLLLPLCIYAVSAASISLPFPYSFKPNGSLSETSTENESGSAYWWVESGAKLLVQGGQGSTLIGDLSPSNTWYDAYLSANPITSDKGLHPQNMFEMFPRVSALNASEEIYFNRVTDNLSNINNRAPYIGESLVMRYVDADNAYYVTLRADGAIAVKKKTNGAFQTLAYKKVLAGNYNSTSAYDLIPLGKWIGLKATVANQTSGAVSITVYIDQGKTGNWTEVLKTADNPGVNGPVINSAGMYGIKTDFADVKFDDYLLSPAAGDQIQEAAASNKVVFSDPFSEYKDGLITNEYAYWNPGSSSAVVSPLWELTSGSIFADGGNGWSGVPDGGTPDPLSATANDSAVFRMTTKESDFADVAVDLDLNNAGLTSTTRTPEVAWDGIHVFLRYQSQYNLYYVSVNRRDNTVVVKKKIPGGPSNGGTYYVLGSYHSYNVPLGSWQHVQASVKNNTDGSVTISYSIDGKAYPSVTDDGSIGGAPIRSAGKVGIRADNANFKVKNFTVTTL